MNSEPLRTATKNADSFSQTKFRIYLVDDHPIIQQALTDMLNHERDLEVCGTAKSPPLALLDTPLAGPACTPAARTTVSGSPMAETPPWISTKHSPRLVNRPDGRFGVNRSEPPGDALLDAAVGPVFSCAQP